MLFSLFLSTYYINNLLILVSEWKSGIWREPPQKEMDWTPLLILHNHRLAGHWKFQKKHQEIIEL
jgi:hypothetical protein